MKGKEHPPKWRPYCVLQQKYRFAWWVSVYGNLHGKEKMSIELNFLYDLSFYYHNTLCMGYNFARIKIPAQLNREWKTRQKINTGNRYLVTWNDMKYLLTFPRLQKNEHRALNVLNRSYLLVNPIIRRVTMLGQWYK